MCRARSGTFENAFRTWAGCAQAPVLPGCSTGRCALLHVIVLCRLIYHSPLSRLLLTPKEPSYSCRPVERCPPWPLEGQTLPQRQADSPEAWLHQASALKHGESAIGKHTCCSCARVPMQNPPRLCHSGQELVTMPRNLPAPDARTLPWLYICPVACRDLGPRTWFRRLIWQNSRPSSCRGKIVCERTCTCSAGSPTQARI